MGVTALFIVEPGRVEEHPGRQAAADSIPDGPIEGVEAYVIDGGGQVFAFAPVVSRDAEDETPYIKAPTGSKYWFHTPNDSHGYQRYCWYQSGKTLRFIRKRKD